MQLYDRKNVANIAPDYETPSLLRFFGGKHGTTVVIVYGCVSTAAFLFAVVELFSLITHNALTLSSILIYAAPVVFLIAVMAGFVLYLLRHGKLFDEAEGLSVAILYALEEHRKPLSSTDLYALTTYGDVDATKQFDSKLAYLCDIGWLKLASDNNYEMTAEGREQMPKWERMKREQSEITPRSGFSAAK